MDFDRPRAARWILGLALAAHCLLFVRVAILFAPDRYLGPSGADRVFYYAYARSLVLDGDLDFRNEVAMRPPSSGLIVRDDRVFNRYPIGAPLLSLPTYVVGHLATLAARTAGWTTVAANGYGRPYALAYSVGQLAWATLGFWLLFRIGCRFFAPVTAALGVAAAMFSTPLLRYTAADLMMSHAASFFATVWTLHAAMRLREAPERRRRWLELGAAAALMVVVRHQNLLYLVVPAWAFWSCLPRGRAAFGALTAGALGAGGLLALQLLVWKVVHGSWIVFTYTGVLRFDGHPRRLLASLAGSDGLGPWLPVLILGLAGCLTLASARRDGLVLACAMGSLSSLLFVAVLPYPELVARSAFDNLATSALGLGAIVAAAAGARRSSWRIAVAVVLGASVAWNLPFVLVDRTSSWPETLSAWWRGLRWLV